jgi:hypothetical protein
MESAVRHADRCPYCGRERLRHYTRSADRSGEAIEVAGPWVAECSNPNCPSHSMGTRIERSKH